MSNSFKFPDRRGRRVPEIPAGGAVLSNKMNTVPGPSSRTARAHRWHKSWRDLRPAGGARPSSGRPGERGLGLGWDAKRTVSDSGTF